MADNPNSEDTTPSGNEFKAPHPGAQSMPQWNTDELLDAPRFTWKNWFAMLGPGLVAGGAAIGGGEWLIGPIVTAKYGGALMWLATVSILSQMVYNIEISRYTLYSGEPIFTGKFRTLPGPLIWVWVYLILDFGSVFPYLAANAATPVEVMILGGEMPDPDNVPRDWWLHKGLSSAIFLGALLPLIFGGKVYNSLRAIMSFKLVTIFGFLLFLALFFSHGSTWGEILTGFVKFGTAPVERNEDINGNGILDPGEDWDSDGNLDVVEERYPPTIDTDDDGKPDAWAEGAPKFNDVDGDGFRDGANVENIFVSLFTGKGFPDIDWTLIAFIAALAAIAGQGGLSNTPISNYTRDQGWGMGHHVGAIPSMVGGKNISLSHQGTVFQPNAESMPRWKRWYRHVVRDQMVVWAPACFIGIALPSMLSVEFLRRGTEADRWTASALTADGVGDAVRNPASDVLATTTGLTNLISGDAWADVFWGLTLFCGFLVLAPSMATSADGVIRRWVDVFWTSSSTMRAMEPHKIRVVYFRVLVGFGIFGLIMLWLARPDQLIKIATTIFNFALGFSCFHTIIVNTVLLPRELRPGWLIRCMMSFAGVYFTMLATMSMLKEMGVIS